MVVLPYKELQRRHFKLGRVFGDEHAIHVLLRPKLQRRSLKLEHGQRQRRVQNVSRSDSLAKQPRLRLLEQLE